MKVKTTAENRKDVVKAMEEILNVKAKYQGPPSFGYKVGEYTVDRDGNVEHESEEAALTMQNELVARGLAEGEADRLNIGIPIEGFTAEGIKNLIYMIHSKQYLLEKAVGKEVFRISDKLVERLDAEENIPLEKVIQIAEEESIEGLAFGEDRIFFCGFPLNEDEARAYAELAACIPVRDLKGEGVLAVDLARDNDVVGILQHRLPCTIPVQHHRPCVADLLIGRFWDVVEPDIDELWRPCSVGGRERYPETDICPIGGGQSPV